MPIDLRSDTVTRPSLGMRRAMAEAEVGDDVYGEDPTVNRLEERCASLFGKEGALFVPSGTMANQIALRLHSRPGDEVLLAPGSHCYEYESGGMAANAAVQARFIGERGVFTAEEVAAAVRPVTDYFPRTALLWFENTHNVAGGRVFPLETMRAAAARAAGLGLRRHLDGARIFNACVATGNAPAAYGALFDSLSFCFSKGLGAPVGSIFLGTREATTQARFLRRRLGGAMRQVGVLAAAALYALDHNVERLAEDHANAQAFANAIRELRGLRVDPKAVETNLVLFDLDPSLPDAAPVVELLRAKSVLMGAVGPRRIRAVTHLDVSRAEVVQAARALHEVLGQTT
jgi:threonine aldolase